MNVAISILLLALELLVVDQRGKTRDLDAVVTSISTERAVFIGETHDRYDQHLSELEVIRRLYERNPMRWAIGVEFIQQPFQSALDAYIAGTIDEREFLKRTEYFDRWGYDYRLYRPIFQFAREHAIPMVALNAPKGTELPKDADKSDTDYRKRLEKIFKQHPEGGNFEKFWEAQLVWDETMAANAAAYLGSHPDKGIVVLAGSGHIEFGSGIPNRVRRRLPDINIVRFIAADKKQKDHSADYFLISKEETLPPAPKLGISMDAKDGVRVKEVTRGGTAASSGIQAKDRIVSIDGQDIKTLGDFRLALMDKKPGDHVIVHAKRDTPSGAEDLTFDILLGR